MIMGLSPNSSVLFKEEVVGEYEVDIVRGNIIGLSKVLELFEV